MEIITFENYDKLSERMYNEATSGNNVVATVFFGDAIGLMRSLIKHEDVNIGGIDIAELEYNGYSKEYYVSLSEDFVLDIEPAWYNDSYLYSEPDIMFIHGDASSAIIKDLPKGVCKEIYIDSDKNEESECTDDECDDIFNVLFDNSKIVTDEYDEPIGISFDLSSILKEIFG